jgi:hypothetical protein
VEEMCFMGEMYAIAYIFARVALSE